MSNLNRATQSQLWASRDINIVHIFYRHHNRTHDLYIHRPRKGVSNYQLLGLET